jgi:hypothetical protein
MEKLYLFIISLTVSSIGFSQLPLENAPKSEFLSSNPDWSKMTKSGLDTCGAYFNNYTGLVKTTDIYFEELRTGDATDFTPYAGRGQRFHANQPIEVSGLQFYSFQTNETLDSLPVVTVLYDYDEAIDSIGIELARDTVWVKHTAFTPLLPDLEVNSYFDEPVTVEEDYIVSLYTYTNDSLKILTNDPGGDGDGEGVSFAYYENPAAPSFTGWYATLPVFGPAYDLDYLINPLVRYQLHDGFTLEGDSICPTIVSATCVDYIQMANFTDPHYNFGSDDPLDKIRWNWGDGFQNDDLATLCHTYLESGTYTVTLNDTLRRHAFADEGCPIELTQVVIVLDSAVANGSFTSSGLNVDFTGTPVNQDSVFWDFGDGSPGSDELNPSHSYDMPGTYDVWFYAYGPCNTDSIQFTVDATDASIFENQSLFQIYPNPSNELVFIKGTAPGTTIRMMNILGEEVLYMQSTTEIVKLNTSTFATGTYFVTLTLEKQTTTRKLIIQH